MPENTTYYDLAMFSVGDTYLASADKRRMTIIDGQLSFQCDLIGDGVIDGWELVVVSGTTVKVSQGLGIIDGFVTATFGDVVFDLPDNHTSYVYLRRKSDVNADLSAFSLVNKQEYLDSTKPLTVTGLVQLDSDYNFITVKWSASTDGDIDYYELSRSTDGFSYEVVATQSTTTYRDEDVSQDSTYYYKVNAYDVNGLKSDDCPAITAETSADTRAPDDPTNVFVVNGDAAIQIVWDASNYLANGYTVSLQPIDTEGAPDGLATVYTYGVSVTSTIIDNLTNGQFYQATLKAISVNDVESPGVVVRGQPTFSFDVPQFETLSIAEEQIDSSYNLMLTITWTLRNESYIVAPSYYLITVDGGEAGTQPSYYSSSPASVVTYVLSDDSVATIRQQNNYTIKVQTVTDEGLVSQPYIIRHRTNKYQPPSPVTGVSVTGSYSRTEKQVITTWTNSTSDFSYNTITVVKTPLSSIDDPNPSPVTLIAGLNIGTAQSYALGKSLIDNKALYAVEVIAHDSEGNESSSAIGTVLLNFLTTTTTVSGFDDFDGVKPPAPGSFSSISGNDQVTIYWTRVTSDFVTHYTVWRAELVARQFISSDWSAIATVPSDTFKFTDYTVENGKRYYYFVTSVDEFGEKSLNPDDDGYFSYLIVPGEPIGHSQLTKPSPISVSFDSHDFVLTWDQDDDAFDGYQIFRSYNDGLFTQVGNADQFATSFTDVGARWKSGTYAYMIRKFRNEGEVIISRSRVVPVGCIPLAAVTASNGSVTRNVEDATDIKLLRDPIKTEVHNQLKKPTHLYVNKGDDRRIRLSDTLIVDDWTTDGDYSVFTTEQDIRRTGSFFAYLDGVQSPYVAHVDIDSGTLTFDQPVFDSTTGGTPPSVSVVFLNTSEVTGVLPAENMDTILASKVTRGKVPFDIMPKIDHYGRFREPLLPTRYPMVRDSAYVFSGPTPSGVTFYDVVKTTTSRLLAASSDGVRLTLTDDASRWTVSLSTALPCNFVHYSSEYDWYFAVAGNTVHYTSDLVSWTEIQGTTGVGVIRGIAEDGDGNIYVTADSGVYTLNPGEFTKLYWSQCAPLELDGGAYGIYYDSVANAILVGGESGIYKTTNFGQSWTKLSGLDVVSPVYSLFRDSGNYFAVTNNGMLRRTVSGNHFAKIATFAVSARKALVFGGEIYVTTDAGLLRSDPNADIYTDGNVKFLPAFSNLQRSGIVPITHALRILDSRMWLGQDERIFSVTSKRRTFLNAEVGSITPSVYLNGVERGVGVYYTPNSKVLFDTKTTPFDDVKIVKDYVTFTLPNGGWVDAKYDAEIVLVVNDNDQLPPPNTVVSGNLTFTLPPDSVHVSNKASDVAAVIRNIVTPFFSARNSNFPDAMKYLKQIVKIADTIDTDALITPDKIIDAERVALLYTSINLFRNNISTDLQSQVTLPAMGGSVTTASGIRFDYDAVNGTVTVYNGATKYTRMALTIKNAGMSNIGSMSHRQLEDKFEEFNSGLPSALASVKQSALVHLGIACDRAEPGQLTDRKLTYQSRFRDACDGTWYDLLNSTVDYKLEIEQNPTSQVLQGAETFGSFSIEYPADVLYVESRGEVWVCGAGGIISVDTTTYECKKVVQTEFYFYNMHLDNGIVYALAEDGPYSIDTSTLVVTQDVDLAPPVGFTSILNFGDTTFISTSDGLYSKRPYEPSWRRVVTVNDSFVRATDGLTFCIGLDPIDTTGGTYVVYYSYAGAVWNRSSQFSGYVISGAAKRYDSIYYSTDKGLLVEDLGRLFGSNGGQSVSAIDLDGDDEPDAIQINAVDADADIVIAGTDEGVFYRIKGNSVVSTGTSQLQTIHKVKAVDGKYWLFANSQVQIEGVSEDKIVELTTGKALA